MNSEIKCYYKIYEKRRKKKEKFMNNKIKHLIVCL